MSGPAVSVVVPTFNRTESLRRAIQSVRNQTFEDWELVVVDDGSTNGTAEVVSAFNDRRVVCVSHGENRGAAAARNTGIRAAGGAHIAFLDSDDEWLPTMLERCLPAFRSGPVGDRPGVVRCDVVDVTPKAERIRRYREGWIFEDLLSLQEGIAMSAVIVRRDVLGPSSQFDESTRLVEDRDFLLRIARGHRFARIPMPLVRIHHDHTDHMNVPLNRLILRERLLAKYEEDLNKRPAMKAGHYGAIGGIHLDLNDARGARRAFWNAVLLDPWHPRWYVWLAVSLLGDRHGPIVRSLFKRWAAGARRVVRRQYVREKEEAENGEDG